MKEKFEKPMFGKMSDVARITHWTEQVKEPSAKQKESQTLCREVR